MVVSSPADEPRPSGEVRATRPRRPAPWARRRPRRARRTTRRLRPAPSVIVSPGLGLVDAGPDLGAGRRVYPPVDSSKAFTTCPRNGAQGTRTRRAAFVLASRRRFVTPSRPTSRRSRQRPLRRLRSCEGEACGDDLLSSPSREWSQGPGGERNARALVTPAAALPSGRRTHRHRPVGAHRGRKRSRPLDRSTC